MEARTSAASPCPSMPNMETGTVNLQRHCVSFTCFVFFINFFFTIFSILHRGRTAPASIRGSPSRSAASSRPQNSWRWTGGSGRQHTMLMEIQLTKVLVQYLCICFCWELEAVWKSQPQPYVLQVSFQHESYLVQAAGQDGEASVAAGGIVATGIEQPLSRQVFIVQELEIRDRLASSQINKFLYLYTSESMPRRAHSNMVRQQTGGAGGGGLHLHDIDYVFPFCSWQWRPCRFVQSRALGAQSAVYGSASYHYDLILTR